LDLSHQQKALEKIRDKKTEIINKPDSFLNKLFKAQKLVTVVTAAYNAENFIEKTIDSVLAQTIGMANIQYIIVDDFSTDRTPEIIRGYAAKHKNIIFVSLKENTGSPGLPRNIGIELATSPYITFLDADDWLAKDGLEHLYKILKETGDDYAVGKTIKIEDKGNSVIGEFASVKERRSISPFSIPHFFYHMGPTARMMSLPLLKQHNIRFPEMRFGEDKFFFINVFLYANAVSTTTAPIYYVNRTGENASSLTRVTHVLDKRRADLKIVDYIKSLSLDVDKEKVILNRIYEYDILKTFDSMLFVRSAKQQDFFDVLQAAVDTTKDLRYDFKEEIQSPLLRAALDLFLEDRQQDVSALFNWFKNHKGKKHVIRGGMAYYEVPFLEEERRYIRMPMLANALDSYIINGQYVQTFEIYGDALDNINTVLIRDRSEFSNEIECSFHIEGNFGQFQVRYDELEKLDNALFTVFIRFNDYQLINIKRITTIPHTENGRTFEFYTSKANNLSLSIKKAK
jgi:glycosyltransferase involved in cell wall biosynthesis